VWLDLRTGLDDASTKALRQIPMPSTANLRVQGIFMNGGHYGHLSKYPYQLVARTASDAAIVWSGAPFTAEEKEAVKRWGCGGANPKQLDFVLYFKWTNKECKLGAWTDSRMRGSAPSGRDGNRSRRIRTRESCHSRHTEPANGPVMVSAGLL
jgi:hypothetical protein